MQSAKCKVQNARTDGAQEPEAGFEYTTDKVARITGGRRVGPDVLVRGASFDSRQVRERELFFALRGERVDGHDFLRRAFAAGAAAAVVERGRVPAGTVVGTLVEVADPKAALGRLATAHRGRFRAWVVGVTGSLGKTTTKDLIAGVLGSRYRTLKSAGNLNTEIGVPMTLFQLTDEHEAAVIEMAMRGRGQIRELARMAQPEVGLITNIGLSHLELLGSQDAIAEAKGELLEELPPTGVAVLNADDPYCDFLATRALRSIRYGFHPEADVRCLAIADCGLWIADWRRGRNSQTANRNPQSEFEWSAPAFGVEGARAAIPLPGRHNVSNALAAAAVGLCLGLDADEIAAGLAGAEISAMRMEVLRGPGDTVLLNDAYNASSPAAMLAALDVLRGQGNGRRQVAVLGSMLELGPASEAAHQEVGEAVAEPGGPDLLLAVGELGSGIARAARARGMAAERVIECPDNAAALEELGERLQPGDVVLVKGSRGVRMEEIVAGLLRAAES